MAMSRGTAKTKRTHRVNSESDLPSLVGNVVSLECGSAKYMGLLNKRHIFLARNSENQETQIEIHSIPYHEVHTSEFGQIIFPKSYRFDSFVERENPDLYALLDRELEEVRQ